MNAVISRVFFLLIFMALFSGCSWEGYRRQCKFDQKTKGTYFHSDTINIRNFVLCNSQNHMDFFAENKPIPINVDSILRVFVYSINKLGLRITSNIDEGNNHCDPEFFKHRVVRIRKIDPERILEIAGDTKGKTVLVPYLYINNAIRFTAYITSGGMAGHNGFRTTTHLSFVGFIVKNNEIIYQKHMRFYSKPTRTETRPESESVPNLAKVEQQHWDELVRRTMHDYIKRLQ